MKYGDKIYFSDELNDEVVDMNIKRRTIDSKYKYVHKNIFYRLWSFITYRLLATPFDFIITKIVRRISFKNKKVLKKHKKGGYFIYANHTDQFSDGFSPVLICFPKKPYLIVNPENVSIPVIGKLTPMWGALPLPDTLQATKNFNHAIEHALAHDNPVIVYPEAHLWPYYTKIRPFDAKSFRYPVNYNKPVYTFTTTYKKRKLGKKPKITIYVDGPFYPDKNLPKKERQQKLRDEVYSKLCERARESDYEFVTYIKKENVSPSSEEDS